MPRDISNTEDVLDSRDIIARIEELEAERDDFATAEAGEGEPEVMDWEAANPEDAAELAILSKLAEEAEGYAADWKYGETLIRDSYFRTYAEELADDCGMIPDGLSWPLTCIDWEQAARELQMDYTSVDFDGVTYWVR